MQKMQQSGRVKPPRTASKIIQPVLKAASTGVTPAQALLEEPCPQGTAQAQGQGQGHICWAEPASRPTSSMECGKEEHGHGGVLRMWRIGVKNKADC